MKAKPKEENRTSFSVLLRQRASLDEERAAFQKFEAEMNDIYAEHMNRLHAELRARVNKDMPAWAEFYQDFDDSLWWNGDELSFMSHIAETLNREILKEIQPGKQD